METIAFLQGFASPGLDAAARFVTALGSERGYIVLLLTVFLTIDADLGRRLGVYLLAAFVVNFHLKDAFGTDRPFVLDPLLDRSGEQQLGYAFPSGHAQTTTVFWGYLAAHWKRAWGWALALAVVLLVALTRLYLGVHYPVDVIGGALIGALLVAAALALDRALPVLRARWRLPRWALLALAVGGPLLWFLLWPPPGREGDLLLGGMAAFLSGPLWFRHRVGGAWWRRALLLALGLTLVFGVLIGSSVLLPEGVKRDPLGGFVRYLLLGWAGVVLTPWLGARLGLAPAARAAPAQASRAPRRG